MKYPVVCGDKKATVAVEGWNPEGESLFSVEERPYRTTVKRISDDTILIRANGRILKAFIANERDEQFVCVKGRCYSFKDTSSASVRRRRSEQEDRGGDVTPPMPSVVVKILVSEGDKVEKGQGLIVVSAMKMETTLKAPYPAIVKKIKTAVNARVAPGDILVELQESEQRHE